MTSQGKLFVQNQPSADVSNPSDLPEHSGSSSGQLSIINYKNASLQAKVIWLAKLASCNFSFRSVDDLGNTFKAMFPDSKIASSSQWAEAVHPMSLGKAWVLT